MTALICGSMAFDTIMVFEDTFKNHILPDKVHMLNVSFFVPNMRREFGGCAGNIAYALHQLGGDGYPMGTVGEDFAPYKKWLDKTGVSQQYLHMVDGSYTAQAYITTDLDDNQITAFHPGAMMDSHVQSVPVDAGITIGIVSPDGRDGMVQHAEQFAAAGIPFIFDPGQGLPMFDGDDLKRFIEQASYVIVNDYEGEMLRERTGLSNDDIAQQVEALIITRGGEGSLIYANGEVLTIPVANTTAVVDPTGCGDAYRGGLLFGLMQGYAWDKIARLASIMGAANVSQNGTQNYQMDLAAAKQHYSDSYGMDW